MTFAELVKLILSGDKAGIGTLVSDTDEMEVKYTKVEIDLETGTSIQTVETTDVGMKNLEFGEENKNQNVGETAESGAKVTLATAETIAYAIWKYTEDLRNEIQDLKTRLGE